MSEEIQSDEPLTIADIEKQLDQITGKTNATMKKAIQGEIDKINARLTELRPYAMQRQQIRLGCCRLSIRQPASRGKLPGRHS